MDGHVRIGGRSFKLPHCCAHGIRALMLLVLTFSICPVHAGPDRHWVPPGKELLQSALDHIYNLEFERAGNEIGAYKSRYPWRPEGAFAEGMVLWMKVLSDLYNPEYDSLFVLKMNAIIDGYEKVPENDSLYVVTKYYKSAAIGFKARLYINRSSWFKAAITGIKAISGILDALEGDYPNTDAKLGTGLYLYYADVIPDQYPFVKPLLIFYPDGNRQQGLEDLKTTSEQGLFARTEAKYIFAQTLYLYEKQYFKAYKLMDELSQSFPNNPVFLRWLASTAYSVGRFEKALQCLDTYEERIRNNVPFYHEHQKRFIYYRRGLIAQRRKKWEDALVYFNTALQPLPEAIEKQMERYHILSLMGKGRCLQKLGRDGEALSTFRQVEKGIDVDGSRSKAHEAIRLIRERQNK